MNNPKISVIIPTYNRANFIKKAIESVLAQTFSDFELLIIDDGSTDNTEEIVRKISDARIHYFKKENGGPASARNLGMKEAQGEYIAFLDSDDYWYKDHLWVLYHYLENHLETKMVYSNLLILNDNGAFQSVAREEFDKHRLQSNNLIHTSSTLFKKNCLNKVGFMDENDLIKYICEDFEFFFKVF